MGFWVKRLFRDQGSILSPGKNHSAGSCEEGWNWDRTWWRCACSVVQGGERGLLHLQAVLEVQRGARADAGPAPQADPSRTPLSRNERCTRLTSGCQGSLQHLAPFSPTRTRTGVRDPRRSRAGTTGHTRPIYTIPGRHFRFMK